MLSYEPIFFLNFALFAVPVATAMGLAHFSFPKRWRSGWVLVLAGVLGLVAANFLYDVIATWAPAIQLGGLIRYSVLIIGACSLAAGLSLWMLRRKDLRIRVVSAAAIVLFGYGAARLSANEAASGLAPDAENAAQGLQAYLQNDGSLRNLAEALERDFPEDWATLHRASVAELEPAFGPPRNLVMARKALSKFRVRIVQAAGGHAELLANAPATDLVRVAAYRRAYLSQLASYPEMCAGIRPSSQSMQQGMPPEAEAAFLDYMRSLLDAVQAARQKPVDRHSSDVTAALRRAQNETLTVLAPELRARLVAGENISRLSPEDQCAYLIAFWGTVASLPSQTAADATVGLLRPR